VSLALHHSCYGYDKMNKEGELDSVLKDSNNVKIVDD